MLRPSIGIDWDDVTAPFNSIAIRMANEKYHPEEPYRLEEITSWANEGRTSVIKEFYNDPELYSRQIPTEETKRGIRRLMQIADVFFITAVSPRFMGVRAEQIMTQFPEFPPENIILGSAKDRVHFDIVLDDAIHNILESKAEYPVLMRKPWNARMTGLLSVNTMSEFVSLVKQIMKASTSKTEKIIAPAVLALVGPSGSGKREITEALCGSVLWWKTFIPRSAPTLPPIAASKKSVLSGTRRTDSRFTFRLAFHLSSPKTRKVTRLMSSSQQRRIPQGESRNVRNGETPPVSAASSVGIQNRLIS